MKKIAIIMGGYSSEYKNHSSAETSSINFWTKQNTTDSASIFFKEKWVYVDANDMNSHR
jgi:D-alanine-D-alanine ligase